MAIESQAGEGTTFRIRLPKHAATSQVNKDAEAHAADPLRILVVDDQPVLCEILSTYLTNDSHLVETAADGAEALEKFSAGSFDLVITDHVMPGISGGELAAIIKERSPRTPVVLLTGFASTTGETDERIENDAVDQVLGKPISQIDLRKAITQVTSRWPKSAAAVNAA
jgi:CheY-like chemotaxis protein